MAEKQKGARDEQVPRPDSVGVNDLTDEQVPQERSDKLKGGATGGTWSKDGWESQ